MKSQESPTQIKGVDMRQCGSSGPYKSCSLKPLRPPRLREGLCAQTLPAVHPKSVKVSPSSTCLFMPEKENGGLKHREN